jgi:hypothetical protein
VRLCLWTAVTNRPIVHPPRWYMSMESYGGMQPTGETNKQGRKLVPVPHFPQVPHGLTRTSQIRNRSEPWYGLNKSYFNLKGSETGLSAKWLGTGWKAAVRFPINWRDSSLTATSNLIIGSIQPLAWYYQGHVQWDCIVPNSRMLDDNLPLAISFPTVTEQNYIGLQTATN